MLKKFSALATALLVGGLVAVGAAPADARVLERTSFDYSESGVVDDFCGSGLQPTYTFEQTGTATIMLRGNGGQLWFHDRLRTVQTFTYNGMTVTDIQPNVTIKDLKIVDNGDGTLSVTVLLAGGARLIGSDGRLLAKDDGQLRLLLTIDIASDEVIAEEVIFGSTGTNDDFCAAILAHWGV